MKIRYSPAARDDLRQLKACLTVEFDAAVAAKSVIVLDALPQLVPRPTSSTSSPG